MQIVIDIYITVCYSINMKSRERENFDKGFKKGVEDAKDLNPNETNARSNEDYSTGYMLGTIYFTEGKNTDSTNDAWSEIQAA